MAPLPALPGGSRAESTATSGRGRQRIYSYKKIIIGSYGGWRVDADETRGLLEALLGRGKDVLRYLWMSYADPMMCPVEPRPWRERPGSFEEAGPDIVALMVERQRW